MVVGTKFEANLNADKIYIDLTYLPDPIDNKFWLTIKNQSLVTLYFKIICNIPNWSMDTPSDGKLGSVAPAVTGTFTPIITRAKPGAEATDSGDLKIEAYTDAGYTAKIGEDSLSCTTYIEDLENWTDVAKSDFDDGTAQTWTLGNMSVVSDESVEVGGYSVRHYHAQAAASWLYQTFYAEKSLSLPNRNKVRGSLFFAIRMRGAGVPPHGQTRFRNPTITVNGTKVLDIPFSMWYFIGPAYDYYFGWFKLTGDLSAYKGQTVTVRFQAEMGAYDDAWVYCWFDRIVIAGED